MGLATVGTILLLARLTDVASDPLIGWLGDRTPARLGRRRIWMAAGTPLVVLAAWQLFRPPADAGAGHLLAWSILLYLGWTMVGLAYQAWGAELSDDYHERTRIAGWREGATVAGTLAAAGLPAVIDPAGGPAAALAMIAVGVALALPITVGACLALVAERPPAPARVAGWHAAAGLVAGNRPFRRLLAAYLLNGLANGLPATLFVLFVTHRLASPEQAGPLLLAYFLAGLVSVPAWLWASRRLGKHRAWCVAMLVACAAFAAVPLLGPGDAGLFLLVAVATGLTLGADLALPGAIQADVVDLDTAAGGGQRTGLLFALWGMATKLALALAVGIAFPILGAAGFVAAGTAQPAAALDALALLYGGAPVLFKLAAIALMWRFPLTEAVQRDLRRRIAASPHPSPENLDAHAPNPAGPRPVADPGARRVQPHEA
ncbi:MFS transporter [Allostella humosa]|nr:MFS transporter [Stella humosa]